jgi:hypothetical protein
MLKSTKYFFLPITVVFLCGIVILVYLGWCNMVENDYHSCVASISSEIQKLNATEDLAANSKDWKILSEEEVDSLMSQVHGYDCGGVENQTLDLWNNKLNIALRKPKDRIEVFVWSNGRDEMSGTNDDLVIPWGEKVPQ